MLSMKNVLAMILAGGRGERLHPLTEQRAKPAVPFGGKYRIIDFTLSNCINSGLRNVTILIQYKSHSLDRHIRRAWNIFSSELGEYITSLPPQHHLTRQPRALLHPPNPTSATAAAFPVGQAPCPGDALHPFVRPKRAETRSIPCFRFLL